MKNAEIAAHFDELGDLYELDGAVVYRVVAYRNAAKAIREAPVSVEQLAREGRATELAGVGKTIAEKIDALRETDAAERVEVAGSVRRWTDDCKDLDIVATASNTSALVDAFAALPILGEVQRAGEAGARAVTHNGLPVDFRIVPPQSFGNLLQHLTGSGKHNEAMRTEAVKRGFHVSEYGLI